MSIEDYISKLSECKDDASLTRECGVADNFPFLILYDFEELVNNFKSNKRYVHTKSSGVEDVIQHFETPDVKFTVSNKFSDRAYTPCDEQTERQTKKGYNIYICMHPKNRQREGEIRDIAEETKEIISYLTANKIPFCMPRSFPRTKLPNGEYEFSKVVYWEPKSE